MKWLLRLLFVLTFSLFLAGLAGADVPAKAKYQRGHKTPPPAVLAARHAAAYKRHGLRVKWLPRATPATYDLRALNRTGPIQDQGQCGSCWDVSATGVVTDAFIASGQFSSTDAGLTLSPQYVLDCGQNGGCNGDDAITVLDMAKSKGLPTTADYGPYIAAPQQCQLKPGTKLNQIADWGFCTPAQQQGMASTQDVKNCLVQYGTISTAVAADGSWDSAGADGVIAYAALTPGDVNHDVAIVGWDDSKQIPGAPSAGAWIIKNQWGVSWAANGYGWLAYGSHQIGTEAAWTTTGQLPPPPPPPPPPGGNPTLTGVVATFSDGSTQTLGSAPAPQGLTPAQLKLMTGQQIADYINSQGKAPVMPPAKPPAPPPAPGKTSSEGAIVKALEGLERRLTERIDKRLDGIEGRVRALEDRSISIPAPKPAPPPSRWTPEQLRRFDEIRDNLDKSLKRINKVSMREGKGVMRSVRADKQSADALPVAQGTAEESYADAYRRALRLGLPLVVWVGGDFCPS